MHTELILMGGGAKGVSQTKALAMLEAHTGRKTSDMFCLIVGTSVGSINGALLASGVVSAGVILEEMRVTLPKVFKRRWFKRAKYSKAPLRAAFDRMLGKGFCMRDAATKLIVTSHEMTEGRPRFFKSWENSRDNGGLGMFEAVDRSSAAPFFFGYVLSDEGSRVWSDGGVGVFNNPVVYGHVEAQRQGWHRDGDVHAVTLGCGHASLSRTPSDLMNDRKLAQAMKYIDPANGGLAHRTACQAMSGLASAEDVGDWWHSKTIEHVIPAALDKMDNVKAFGHYVKLGERMGGELIAWWDSIN